MSVGTSRKQTKSVRFGADTEGGKTTTFTSGTAIDKGAVDRKMELRM